MYHLLMETVMKVLFRSRLPDIKNSPYNMGLILGHIFLPQKSMGIGKRKKSNTTTLFEMGRCTDETCKEIDNNAILDVSPNSKEDPLTWFKVGL